MASSQVRSVVGYAREIVGQLRIELDALAESSFRFGHLAELVANLTHAEVRAGNCGTAFFVLMGIAGKFLICLERLVQELLLRIGEILRLLLSEPILIHW